MREGRGRRCPIRAIPHWRVPGASGWNYSNGVITVKGNDRFEKMRVIIRF